MTILGEPWARITGLNSVMEVSSGSPSVLIGLLDGPVAADHPDFAEGSVIGSATDVADSATSRHGTAVAGVLVARRGSAYPGICPGCHVLPWPVFAEDDSPRTTPAEVAAGIVACILAGARVINLSVAFSRAVAADSALAAALDLAVRRGVLVLAAAGNGGRIAGSQLTEHPWVVPVAACDDSGRPLAEGNLGSSIGKRGVLAPGSCRGSLLPGGGYGQVCGTSVATALVTGVVALAWSAAPNAPAEHVRHALLGLGSRPRRIVPPLLDAVAFSRVVAPQLIGV